MKKSIIIPVIVGVLLIILLLVTCSGSNKIKLEWAKVTQQQAVPQNLQLKVYVENSGSMDGYMCPGSTLKDAVFDYVSNLQKYSKSSSLFYVNSEFIPYSGNLSSFITNLTPESFAKAGGNRSRTYLRQIFSAIEKAQTKGSVSVFVSDCVLGIPGNVSDFLGYTEISMKNTFAEALSKNPNLGVEVIKMDSKFAGFWYSGMGKEWLENVRRPYYIWLIGDKRAIAYLNKQVPVEDIYGGIKAYCAFSTPQKIPFDIEKTTYVVNHSGEIVVPVLINLDESLQSDAVIRDISNYHTSDTAQVSVIGIDKITSPGSSFSHVLNVRVRNPKNVHAVDVTFSYPFLPEWVVRSNDETGRSIRQNMDKTTGILALIRGVASAYKQPEGYGTIHFELKNK